MNVVLGLGIKMKIEKSSYTEIYNVETEKYNIAIQYHEDLNIGYSEWEILSLQDKNGLEVKLSKGDENELKDCIVEKIIRDKKESNNELTNKS